jgi:predicted dienelactone hydrolase
MPDRGAVRVITPPTRKAYIPMNHAASADVGPGSATPVISVRPVTLAAPGRGRDLQVRVSAPTAGRDLPVVVFSHGMTLSMDDYGPLADFWAARGFVVIQPTHLDSLGLAPDDPRTPLLWRIRAGDLTRILDQLGTIEAGVPGLAGRVDRDRVAAAGHSWGAQTASMLAGARVIADGAPGESLADPRVRAAVLLSLPGTGAADLLTLFGAEHGLGGIQGDHDTRTTDESPERVALVQQVTLAYLRTALGLDDGAWPAARDTLAATSGPLGRIDSK